MTPNKDIPAAVPTHNGTAVAFRDAAYPLKLLLPATALDSGAARIATLEGPDQGGRIELQLASGQWHELRLSENGPVVPASPAIMLHNIGQLLTMHGPQPGLVEDANLLIRDGRIAEVIVGPVRASRAPDALWIDAAGKLVSPGLVDPHTHPVFAGSRHHEFALKAEGASYLEIHKAGGGIHATVAATLGATPDELAASCRRNIAKLLAWGVTTCEAKSGYALETAGELRLLRAIRETSNSHPVDLSPTFLGAHTLPKAYCDRRDAYIDVIVDEMLPQVAVDRLATSCDAYCEDGAFRITEVRRIFEAARQHGLALRLHAEQFTDQGGAQLAAELGALSADHLEAISAEGIAALARSKTIAVLLPIAALSCRSPWPPAKALKAAGVRIALGTDLNPGSSYSAALPLAMSLACTQLGLSCEDAWAGVTVNAAAALGREDIGRLCVGSPADLVIYDAPDYRYVPYHIGENLVRTVIKAGQVVYAAGNPSPGGS